MRVLVTGADGFVGSALVARLQADGVKVLRGVRRQAQGAGRVQVDLEKPGDWSAALAGIDAVVHAAARVHVMRDVEDPLPLFRRVNVEGTLELARQAGAAGVKRFVFVSSVKVNGEQTRPGQPFRADDLPRPEDAYGVSKMEAERGLFGLVGTPGCADAAGLGFSAQATGTLKAGMEVTVVRPPLVYGPGVRANFLSMMRALDRGLPLPLASIRNQRSLVALDNLVDLLVRCLTHPAAANRCFMVSDGEDVSTPELLRRTASALGRNARLFPLPEALLKLAALCVGKPGAASRLCSSLQVDSQPTRATLNWTPPLSLDQGLARAAAAYRRQVSA